ncbi:flagellar biosynthesis regulator FlaF [Paracoccaceae bacterium Fryx2]|nr:flagellar biosynthesis regulator FlaF [Paracoccaceae bacterium Fryx2]
MNALNLARNAYGRPEAPVRSARSVEYELFARITQRLSQAWSRRKTDHAGLVAALHDNTQMWRTLAADVASSANALPTALRAQLFYLFEFTAQHSPKVLESGASAEVLVDINTAVMRGLRGEGGGA